MKLRITSDGTSRGTKVLTESGDMIERVTAVEWRCHLETKRATVRLELADVPVEVVGESGRQADLWTLCCECGEITSHSGWVMLVYDVDTDKLREPREHEGDPIMVCPVCKHAHRDDDSGAGLYMGSLEEMRREREQLVTDPVWVQGWDDQRAERVANAALREGP